MTWGDTQVAATGPLESRLPFGRAPRAALVWGEEKEAIPPETTTEAVVIPEKPTTPLVVA